MKLRYCGREFELDIEGLSKWLDDPQGHKTSRMDGSWGHPSDAGWNSPTWREYFSGMSYREITQHISDRFYDGEHILPNANPQPTRSARIEGMLLMRDIISKIREK